MTQQAVLRWFTGIVLVVACAGCSNDSPTSVEPPANKDYMALGWSNFEIQKYDSAVINFTSAYNQATTAEVRAGALCGRGWSYTYKRDVGKGKADFTFALGLTGISSALQNDIYAGGALALYSLNDFSTGATYANAVLTSNSSYLFNHDTKVTARRVRILLAECYFGSGQFSACAQQLDVLDAAHAPHAADPPALLAVIASLLNTL